MKFATVLLIAGVSAYNLSNQEKLFDLMQISTEDAPAKKECPEPLTISEDELHYQLGEFSRNFEMKNWDNAMKIKEGLAK